MRTLALALLVGAACAAAGADPVAPGPAGPRAATDDEEDAVQPPEDTRPAVVVTTLQDVAARRLASGNAYVEFLRVPAMNAGLYELATGARDGQSPHAADELYHVVAGRAVFVADGERTAVGPGSLIYVKAGIEHRFEEITEDLSVLVVFAGD